MYRVTYRDKTTGKERETSVFTKEVDKLKQLAGLNEEYVSVRLATETECKRVLTNYA